MVKNLCEVSFPPHCCCCCSSSWVRYRPLTSFTGPLPNLRPHAGSFLMQYYLLKSSASVTSAIPNSLFSLHTMLNFPGFHPVSEFELHGTWRIYKTTQLWITSRCKRVPRAWNSYCSFLVDQKLFPISCYCHWPLMAVTISSLNDDEISVLMISRNSLQTHKELIFVSKSFQESLLLQ